MKLGCLAQIAVIAVAIMTAVFDYSFWWDLIPAFAAGSLQISNGPGFDIVERANREGRLGVFPFLLLTNILPWLAVAGVVYWITAHFIK
jgi:hypothetical protein